MLCTTGLTSCLPWLAVGCTTGPHRRGLCLACIEVSRVHLCSEVELTLNIYSVALLEVVSSISTS